MYPHSSSIRFCPCPSSPYHSASPIIPTPHPVLFSFYSHFSCPWCHLLPVHHIPSSPLHSVLWRFFSTGTRAHGPMPVSAGTLSMQQQQPLTAPWRRFGGVGRARWRCMAATSGWQGGRLRAASGSTPPHHGHRNIGVACLVVSVSRHPPTKPTDRPTGGRPLSRRRPLTTRFSTARGEVRSTLPPSFPYSSLRYGCSWQAWVWW